MEGNNKMSLRNVLVISVCLLMSAGVWLAIGQTQSAPLTGKIAVVHPELILQNTDEGKQQMARLQQVGNARQQALATAADQLQTLQQQYQQLPPNATPQQRAQLERQMQEQDVKVRRMREDIESELGRQQQTVMEDLAQKLQVILQEYGRTKQLDVILRADVGGLAYVNPALDATAEVITAYNQKHPVAASPAPTQ
jgi:outer membrane protein